MLENLYTIKLIIYLRVYSIYTKERNYLISRVNTKYINIFKRDWRSQKKIQQNIGNKCVFALNEWIYLLLLYVSVLNRITETKPKMGVEIYYFLLFRDTNPADQCKSKICTS
jgi:hypothetical protein